MSALREIVPGMRFGRRVVSGIPFRHKNNGVVRRFVVSKCDCGTIEPVAVKNIIRRQSCGCLNTETTAKRSLKHVFARVGKVTPEFRVWAGMLTRCSNPKVKAFERYGGRGIAVCDRWRNSFPTFLADMGPRPSPKHQIDRIDNDGNYCPKNCRWVMQDVQARNKSNARLISHAGKTLSLCEWAEETGITADAIYGRLKLGWSTEKALTTPLNKRTEKIANA